MRARLPGLGSRMHWRRCGSVWGGVTLADVGEAAWRLLRTINENQAHGRESAVVELGEQEAMDARLRPESTLYRSAVWWLLDMGALVPDQEANERLRNASGAQHHDFSFRITRRGMDILRRA